MSATRERQDAMREPSKNSFRNAWINFLLEHPTRGGAAEQAIFAAAWQAATADMDELLGALRAVVADAKDRNEPGQSWITIRGGLIDDGEAVLARYGKSPDVLRSKDVGE